MRTRRLAAPILGALLVGLFGPLACSGDGSGPDSDPDPDRPGPVADQDAATSTTLLSRTQTATRVGVRFQAGSFLVTVGHVVQDTASDEVHVGLRMENLASGWRSVPADGVLLLDSEEHHLHLPRVPRVPPGVATDVAAVARRIGTPIGNGTLRWGHAEEPATLVDLGDGTAVGFGPPLDIPVDAWGQIGKHTVHLNAARLYADSVRGPRTIDGQRVLRLGFDEYTSRATPVNGFVPMDHLLLEWPDGTVVEPLSGSDGRFPMSWTVGTGASIDFPVPSDPEGEYSVLLASVSRHAVSLLHPDLVERIAMVVEVPSLADHGPVAVPGDDDLPHPRLPTTSQGHGTVVDLDLDVGEANVPGFGVAPRHLRWDPSEAKVRVDVDVRRLTPAQVEVSDGLFDVPSSFDATVALGVDGQLFNGLIEQLPTDFHPGESVEVSWEFPFVDTFDPASATLFVGGERVSPTTIPLGDQSPYPLEPTAPVERSITAPAVTAGNYTVQLVAYRFGLPRPLDQPPPGLRALEVIFDVTAREVEPPGAFGLLFRARTQLFLASPDGYLVQSDDHDFADLADGQTVRLGASFYLPALWEPGPMGFVVRSVDELTSIDDAWVEVAFGAELHGAGELDEEN